jgi:uncharacterized membrane protein (UPF0127 family)
MFKILRSSAASVAILALLELAVLSCRHAGPREQSGLPEMKLQIGNTLFTLEIADTDETRTKGLMFRKSMPADRGMIFVFDREEMQSFWMKNTLIPLDILYINSAGKIVSISNMFPHDLSGVMSEAPALFAIELNEGAADKAGVKPGDTLEVWEALRKVNRAPATRPK